MNKFFYLLWAFLALSISHSAQAQQWQWAKTGHVYPHSSSIGIPISQATDRAGNVYIVYQDTVIYADGHRIKGYSGLYSTCIVSYGCSGRYRWGKIIENSGADNGGYLLQTDDSGGVYVGMNIDARDSAAALDEDAFVAVTNKNTLFIKYDTSGKYLWHIMPGNDTLKDKSPSTTFDFSAISMAVAPSGDIHTLAIMPPGLFCGGRYVVPADSAYSAHMLCFDKNGHFQKAFPLPVYGAMDDLLGNRMLWDPADDVYYLSQSFCVYGTIKMDPYTVFGKFDHNGNLLWVKPTGGVFGVGQPKIVLDQNGDLILKGASGIIKMTKAGAAQWATDGSGIRYFDFAYADNKIGVSGFSNNPPVRYVWGSDTIGKSYKSPGWPFVPDSTNNGTFFVTLDAITGTVLDVDSFLGTNIRPFAMSGSKTGSFFITGSYGNTDYSSYTTGVHNTFCLPNVDTISSKTLNSFLIKYGPNDCLSTGIPPITQKDLRIYPNPASDYFIVENAALNGTINVYNMLGQKVYTHSVDQAKQSIPTAQFAPGMYMVEVIETNQHRSVSKIIKR